MVDRPATARPRSRRPGSRPRCRSMARRLVWIVAGRHDRLRAARQHGADQPLLLGQAVHRVADQELVPGRAQHLGRDHARCRAKLALVSVGRISGDEARAARRQARPPPGRARSPAARPPAWTRSRVSSATTPGSVSTRDTVIVETPARRETSCMVGLASGGCGHSTPASGGPGGWHDHVVEPPVEQPDDLVGDGPRPRRHRRCQGLGDRLARRIIDCVDHRDGRRASGRSSTPRTTRTACACGICRQSGSSRSSTTWKKLVLSPGLDACPRRSA